MKANGSQELRPSESRSAAMACRKIFGRAKKPGFTKYPVKSVDIYKLDAAIRRVLAKQ